jgi:hypothetical protein
VRQHSAADATGTRQPAWSMSDLSYYGILQLKCRLDISVSSTTALWRPTRSSREAAEGSEKLGPGGAVMMWIFQARACGPVRSEDRTDYRRAYGGNIFPFKLHGVYRGSNCCLEKGELDRCKGVVLG